MPKKAMAPGVAPTLPKVVKAPKQGATSNVKTGRIANLGGYAHPPKKRR